VSSTLEIRGHPAAPLLDELGDVIQMITVCAECGEMRTILFLTRDRWYCTKCRAEGAAPPNLYPVA
jgi:translation initiation factor 2 beta subunit (eIF-2beta)/eIF-5